MNDRSGDGIGSSEVEIRTNSAAKFTNMIIARFRESRYLVRESEVFIKDKAFPNFFCLLHLCLSVK